MAAAGGDAAGRTEAAGVAIAVSTRESQRYNGVDPLGHRKAVLLHFVLRKLAVSRNLDARTLKGRGSIGADARGREVACRPHVILAVKAQGFCD